MSKGWKTLDKLTKISLIIGLPSEVGLIASPLWTGNGITFGFGFGFALAAVLAHGLLYKHYKIRMELLEEGKKHMEMLIDELRKLELENRKLGNEYNEYRKNNNR